MANALLDDYRKTFFSTGIVCVCVFRAALVLQSVFDTLNINGSLELVGFFFVVVSLRQAELTGRIKEKWAC